MKTSCISIIRAAYHLFGGSVCGGAILMTSSGAQAQNLFEADGSGYIYEFTLGGVESTFASGVGMSSGLAFNSAGDLFVVDAGSTIVYEFTSGGVRSYFTDWGSPTCWGMAIDSASNVYVSCAMNGCIYKYTPNGTQ